jgi:hypothetical protein
LNKIGLVLLGGALTLAAQNVVSNNQRLAVVEHQVDAGFAVLESRLAALGAGGPGLRPEHRQGADAPGMASAVDPKNLTRR